MIQRKFFELTQISIAVCFLLFPARGNVHTIVPPQPKNEVMGIRLNMSEDEARSRLKRIATQQKEEREREGEGEQEVWLLRDRRFAYLVVAFDREHKVRYIITSVRPGARVRYSELADTRNAIQANDGRNYAYTWTVKAEGEKAGYGLVARGSSPQFFVSYTLYRLLR